MSEQAIKVLLVDDEADYLQTLSKRLSMRKLEVYSATSGQEALAELDKHSVDVVVLDVRMPGMDGLEAIKEIKKRFPMLEVIMLTGHADIECSIEGMGCGAFDYLLKPVAIDELLYKIQDAYKVKTLKERKIADLKAAAQERDQHA
ncbi:chemotaxis protein CheY [Desulfocarbo indianensis]|nr:chemotaxis protein CheY [Desulfocarbo indianensis]